jgi:undecaprenyl-diphosphatase
VEALDVLERIIEAIILGIVQGLTEWLPISSTAHLRLVDHFFGLDVPILFDVVLHVGTLIVVLTFFRSEVRNMLAALVKLEFETESGTMIPLLMVGVIPTLAIGAVFGTFIDEVFHSILPIAIALICCGLLLYASKRGKHTTDRITYVSAIIIGTAQGIAIIPGISRSGATMALALLLGIPPDKAFRFSFLLSIPAILGALSLTIMTGRGEVLASNVGWAEILVGLISAMLVGYGALKLVGKTIAHGRLHLFAVYCWLLGI